MLHADCAVTLATELKSTKVDFETIIIIIDDWFKMLFVKLLDLVIIVAIMSWKD